MSPSAAVVPIVIGLGCSGVDTCLTAGLQQTGSSSILPLVDFSAPPLSVTTSSLPAAVSGVAYSTTLQATGGTGTSTWSVNGSLPPGLTLNAATGAITGKPTTPGTYSFTAQLASGGPPAQSASVSLSISVAAVPKLSAGSVRVSSTGVTVQLGCSGSGTCKGTAKVTAVEHFAGNKPSAVTAHTKAKTKTITLALGHYSLGAGKLGKVTLKLNGKAKALLSQLHKISGKLTLTPAGAKKPSITRTVTFKSGTTKKK